MRRASIRTMKTTKEKITALRAVMKEHALDGFVIPKADEYQGEFVAPYAERLQWLTGFTGSAGIAVVLQDKACIFTDGRYRLQIGQQVDGKFFETGDSVKIGVHGWLKSHADGGAKIGFDPWLHTPDQIQKLQDECPHLEFVPVSANLIDAIWTDQPDKPCGNVRIFPQKLAGQSLKDKKAIIAQTIAASGAKAAMITLPDSIAWLLNVRGSDIDYIPSVLSYAVIFADENEPVWWLVNSAKLGADVRSLCEGAVRLAGLEDLNTLKDGPVMLDFMRSPEYFREALSAQGLELINAKDPCIDCKAVKTDAEIAALKKAHIHDACALAKFLHWLDARAGQGALLDEISVAEKLESLRAENPAYKGHSFPTISGFGENGAIVHYRATQATNKPLEQGNLLLIDSGGQYCDDECAGTTDITRTIAIGEPSAEMRRHFTLVLKGHIALAMAKFPLGTTGAQLDVLARTALWNENLDYAHGTGHGVGCYLAVHEEAASLSPRCQDPLKPGMLISNEPGYYKDASHGIRIENLVLVREGEICGDTGAQMLEFETISLAPIDRNLIDVDMLSAPERKWLNAYHKEIYEDLKDYLEKDQALWLEAATQTL